MVGTLAQFCCRQHQKAGKSTDDVSTQAVACESPLLCHTLEQQQQKHQNPLCTSTIIKPNHHTNQQQFEPPLN